jgi:HEAT repeat protein
VPDLRDDQHPKIWSVLFTGETTKRLEAVDLLSKIDLEWPVAWFSLLLADSDAAVAKASFSALRKRGKSVIPLLSLQRLSPLSKVRQYAVRLIGEFGSLGEIQDVIASLFDPVVDVREEGRRAVESILNRSLDVASHNSKQRHLIRDLIDLFASLSSVSQRNVRSVMVSSLLAISVENPDDFWEVFPGVNPSGRSAIELEIISRPTARRIDLLYHGLVAGGHDMPEKALTLIDRLLNKDTISDHVDSLHRLPHEVRIAVLRFLADRGILNTFFEYFPWVRRELRTRFLRLFGGDFGEEFFSFQLTLLENPNPLLIATLIENFLSFERSIPYPTLQLLLKHPSAPVKRAAAQYLLYRGNQQAVRDLMPLLKEQDPEISRLVVKTIGRISRDYLIDHFSQISEIERRSLTRIMQRIDQDFVESLTDTLGGLDEEDRVHMTLILAELTEHPNARETIENLLTDQNERVRASAVRGIGHMKAEEIDDATIRGLFNDPDPRVRSNLIESLPVEKKVQWSEKIEESTHSDIPRERANAVLAMFEIGRVDAEIALMQMLRHPDSWMRTSGLWVLARVDCPHLMFKALDLVEDVAPHVRIHALRSIMRKGNQDLARQITPALSDPNSDVREAAHQAIKAQMGIDYRG